MKTLKDFDQGLQDWYNSRPKPIRDFFDKCPPWQLYKVHNGTFPGRIISYDEERDGTISCKVEIDSPLMPRTVFGLRPEHLTPISDED